MEGQEIVPVGAPMGRPSIYSDDIAMEICNRLACDESLISICRDDHMPAMTTVYRWRHERDDFREKYTRAREDQGRTAADTITEIRKAVERKEITPDAGRAMADMAKWEASRRASREFGDKVQIESRNRTATMPVLPDDPAAAAKAYEDFVKGGE